MHTTHNAAMLHGFKLPHAFEHAVLLQLQTAQIVAASRCQNRLWVSTQDGNQHTYMVRLH